MLNEFCLGIGTNFQQYLKWSLTYFYHLTMYLWEVVFSMLTIIKPKYDQLWKLQTLPHPTVSNVQPRFNSYVKIDKYINSILCKLAFIFSKRHSNINWNLFLNNFSDLSWVSTWFIYLFNIPIYPGSYKKFLSQKGIKNRKHLRSPALM